MNVKELVDSTQSQILAETIDNDTLYNVKDLRPILRLTNAQMRVPTDPDNDVTSTSKGLVQLDDMVLCVDDGTYLKDHFYQYNGYGWVHKGKLAEENKFEEIAHKTTVVSSSSTDTQYPSAKAVYTSLQTNLQTKENTSNKSTTLSSSSTTTQYPASKTVYDFVLAQLGNYALKSGIEIREV